MIFNSILIVLAIFSRYFMSSEEISKPDFSRGRLFQLYKKVKPRAIKHITKNANKEADKYPI
jgi:hypothetical protein